MVRVARQLNEAKLVEVINHINIIRPVGSENHTIVYKYIMEFVTNLKWDVSIDAFEENTVIGRKKFRNIVATSKILASRQLTLACHYESKLMPNFHGTIDSAIPCAILLNIASSLNAWLTVSKSDIALQLIFFDGEEAFVDWNSADSIYGSRHLVKTLLRNESGCSALSKIDLLILLDLIGAKDTRFPFFSHCDPDFYRILLQIENLSKSARLLKNHHSSGSYFSGHNSGGIEDDHLPFVENNVPVLHMIPSPFPPQWHTQDDTFENVDLDTVHDIELLVAGFVTQYLRLNFQT